MLEGGLGATVERAMATSRWMSSTVPAYEKGLGAGPVQEVLSWSCAWWSSLVVKEEEKKLQRR